MSLAAASLELRSEIVSSNVDPDAVGTWLEAAASLRSAIDGGKRLHACQSLASPVQRILEFVTGLLTGSP